MGELFRLLRVEKSLKSFIVKYNEKVDTIFVYVVE